MTDILPPPPPQIDAVLRAALAALRSVPVVSTDILYSTGAIVATVVEDPSLPAGQIRLRTEQGDLVVATQTRLAPGTDISVEIRKTPSGTVATLRPVTQQVDPQTQTQEPPPVAPPLPPVYTVEPGDKLVALILSGTLPPPPTPPAPLTPDQAQLIRQTVLQSLSGAAPAKIPLPLSVQTALIASDDPAAFIAKLPTEQQAVLRALLPAPHDAPDAATPQTPLQAQASSPPPENDDTGLLAVLKTLTGLRAPPSAAAPLSGLVKNLLPLLQGLGTPQASASLPASPSRATPTVSPTLSAPLFPAQLAGAELRIISIAPPPTLQPSAAPATPVQSATPSGQHPSSPTPLLGTVIGTTREGMAVITTPQADFVLTTRTSLTVGTVITFEAKTVTPQEVAGRVALSFDPLSHLTWPALDEALTILTRTQPEAAARLSATVPTPGPRMVPATLFFLAALRLGQVENWLGGPMLSTLREAGGKSTADTLTRDFTRIGKQATEALSGEWRSFSVPVLYDQALSQIQIFVRKDHQDDQKDDAGGGRATRFVLNLSLSRLGDMQLDGMMRAASPTRIEDKRLDLTIRTPQRLSPRLINDLRDAFALGLSESALTGNLSFEAGRSTWVSPGGTEAAVVLV